MEVLGSISGLSKNERMRWRGVALQAWIDDSGKGQEPVYLLAGYLGAPSQWASFSDDWNDMLQGPPKLAYMKAIEANRRKGQFKGWTETERDGRLLQAVSLIKKHGVIGIKVGLKHKDFDKILKLDVPGLSTPYEPIMAHMMITTLNLIEDYLPPSSKTRAQVEFLFDCGTVRREELEICYKALIKGSPHFQRYFYSEPSFRDDKRFKPLQAADLYAWHVRRLYALEAKNKTLDTEVWQALQRIVQVDFMLEEQDLVDVRERTVQKSLIARHLFLRRK